jgi:hypothetical protein
MLHGDVHFELDQHVQMSTLNSTNTSRCPLWTRSTRRDVHFELDPTRRDVHFELDQHVELSTLN